MKKQVRCKKQDGVAKRSLLLHGAKIDLELTRSHTYPGTLQYSGT